MSVALECVAELGVCDPDECGGSLRDGPAAKLSDAVFGDDVIDGVLHSRDGRAGAESGNDARDGFVTGRRVQDDEAHPAIAVHRAACEVGLPAAAGVIPTGDHLRVALAE